ncbi:DUF4907 domain-containing protein [Maribacter sp. X9]|uniref:DUF4907 domain-containing protein n=1 Tax=Maribacter sp. X9 TaxID=3402159 RepID=UPI003AF372E8
MSYASKITWVIILFFTIFFSYTFYDNLKYSPKSSLHCETIRVKNGFGYKISNGEKVLILQEFIPGISGEQSFDTESQALSVGNLVIWKLENGKSPILKPSDLERLNIP